jgi:alpha-1,6-mannosyltransferase
VTNFVAIIPRHGARYGLWCIALLIIAATAATPFSFHAEGDIAYIVLAAAVGLLAWIASCIAEQAPRTQTLWLIFGVAILLRIILLFTEPLLSSDIYRYVWDGKVQAASINPYLFPPADDALAFLRDEAVYPHIYRADYAVTIYPPVAQIFFFLATRFGENITVMKLAFLVCEAGTVAFICLMLQWLGRPLTQIVAYAWHPLPMWEIANNGHVDALMVALMMCGIWLAMTGRVTRGTMFVALAAMAKPFAVVALPAFWKPCYWKAPLAVIVTVALCYLPYLSAGWGVFGFLTQGYLSEETLLTGSAIWPLAAWRWIVGVWPWDYPVYLSISGLVLAVLAIMAINRNSESPEHFLTDIKRLLLAFLLLLSPNYPWYFLALTPFLALGGGAPVWAVTLGALFLQDEVDWDMDISMLTRKSALYGLFIAACAYEVWQAWRSKPTKSDEEVRHAR